MEIILREDVENLGLAYDLVDVKPGYARNFLIPEGKAVLATPVEKENLNAILENLAKEQATQIKEAQETLKKLDDVDLKMTVKAGSNGKLYGSINNAKISEELAAKGIDIDRKYIKVPGNNIKRAGKYTATIRLHRDVVGDFDFEIIADIEKSKTPKASKAEAKALQANKEEESGTKKVSLDDVAHQALPASARAKKEAEAAANAPSDAELEASISTNTNEAAAQEE